MGKGFKSQAGIIICVSSAISALNCSKLSAKKVEHGEESHHAGKKAHDASEHSDGEGPNGDTAGYLAAITPVLVTPVIPQCKSQKNAPRGQLAPSYFEEMQACSAKLPPQLMESEKSGSIDEKGDCNLGIVESTEVVCHYHSGFEFVARNAPPKSPRDTVELHCIAFRLEHGKRILTPIVFGTQLTCKKGTLPGNSEHHAAESSCGTQIASLFSDAASCDMRCCRDGTLTKPNPGIDVRPSFAICAQPSEEVDCSSILANMHAHPPHRPHDRIGPDAMYRKSVARQIDKTDEGKREAKTPKSEAKSFETDLNW